MSGKTIDMYLINGAPDSIVRVRLSNWSGIAYKIPYAEVKNCNLKEIHRPGVYFLFGENENGTTCYVGESDDALRRLKQHLNDKDSWNEAIAFISDDLDTTIVLRLEDKCFKELNKCNRCEVLTKQTNSNQYKIDEKEDIADEFFKNMRIVLTALGYAVLEPVKSSAEIKQQDKLYLESGDVKAAGTVTADGFTVFTGSRLSSHMNPNLSDNYKRRRQYLLGKGIVKEDTFENDFNFNSSSEAAAVLLGYGISGLQAWHYEDGKTLKQVNDEATKETE